jgi:hypothetical protein
MKQNDILNRNYLTRFDKYIDKMLMVKKYKIEKSENGNTKIIFQFLEF